MVVGGVRRNRSKEGDIEARVWVGKAPKQARRAGGHKSRSRSGCGGSKRKIVAVKRDEVHGRGAGRCRK